MPPVGAITLLASSDPNSVGGPSSVPPSADTGMAAMRDALSCEAGVTVRLLASLPAGLGQNLDAAV